MLNPYNLDININLIKAINNYKNYSSFNESLNKLALYKSDFTTLFSFFKMVIIKFSFKILLVDKAISTTKKYKNKRIKKTLTPKSKIFSNTSKYFKYILEVAY
ncbi:hypothetical protein C8035_v007795 [Colletotrichum spinosum]|uniref:Uncharacterized protein n=1 Tax=Colletotrichum spinosum TaxID=1347390 RepID=A0A4R8Q156_9PEZI|nr:hypothetical protein C8035_v007795 [Colletotrichum spinosum]